MNVAQPVPAARAATLRPTIRRIAALGVLAIAGTYALLVAASASPSGLQPPEQATARTDAATRALTVPSLVPPPWPAELPVAATVGLHVITFVDRSRVARFHNGKVKPRTLVTQIRYPALGAAVADDVPDATPLSAAGPYPLIVFAHGFAQTPTAYARLLDAWARAGYVVAAPLFPLTQQSVPGGRREADLINQPADMSFVITRMLAVNQVPTSFLYGLIAANLIAVGGQSDGAATALAEAYDPAFADPRVRAAIVLSGAELSIIDDKIPFAAQGPPLLATQGSKDTLNEPSATHHYFNLAPRPKFLLTLIGATHLPPYTTQQPYLGIVEQVTIAFLDHFLLAEHGSLLRMRDFGNLAGIARLIG